MPTTSPLVSSEPEPTSTATPTPAPTAAPSASPPPLVTPGQPIAPWVNPALVAHVPILMYHVVGPALDAPNELRDLVVPTATFVGQMTALHDRGWQSITMAELAADLSNGVAPPSKTFVITVDDGHVDGLTIIDPILRKLGYRATFYLVTGRLEHSGYLTQVQAHALVGDGMDVGNHTVHHPNLAVASHSTLVAEIGGAETALGAITGIAPVTLAYPSGKFNASVVSVADQVGLALAVTTQYGALETWATRLTLPRVRVHGDSTVAGLLEALRLLGL
jgi:peptidoglycan/xylan/chitin deacetylase (PgdA/CDA1 family)